MTGSIPAYLWVPPVPGGIYRCECVRPSQPPRGAKERPVLLAYTEQPGYGLLVKRLDYKQELQRLLARNQDYPLSGLCSTVLGFVIYSCKIRLELFGNTYGEGGAVNLGR